MRSTFPDARLVFPGGISMRGQQKGEAVWIFKSASKSGTTTFVSYLAGFPVSRLSAVAKETLKKTRSALDTVDSIR